MPASDRPELIGHRGAPREAPENTIASFTRALELGAEALELDVHVSADGVPVVHHDPVLAAGATPLHALTLAQLRRAAEALGKAVPTLEEVLAMEGAHGLYVELKGRDAWEPALEVIRGSAARPRCALHSFDHRAVLRARTHDQQVPGGILLASYLVDTPHALREARARDLWMWWEFIDRALVDAVHTAGGRVVAWTVNDAASARGLAEMGVDGICTDDLPLVAEAIHDVTRG